MEKETRNMDRRQQIVDFIKKNPHCDIDGIARYCQVTSFTVRATVKKMAKIGELEAEEISGKNKWGRPYIFYRYSVPTKNS